MASTSEQQPPPTPTDDILYEKLHAYPFADDPEFGKGLSIILGHPEVPGATPDEVNREDDLVLQAKCFYFSRKENLAAPLSVAAYKAWLRGGNGNRNAEAGSSAGDSSTAGQHDPSHYTTAAAGPSSESNAAPAADQAPAQEPAYPSSFAHIVELITTGQPVPGIQEIPDTVLTGQDTASTKPKRRKPWEKEDDGPTSNDQ